MSKYDLFEHMKKVKYPCFGFEALNIWTHGEQWFAGLRNPQDTITPTCGDNPYDALYKLYEICVSKGYVVPLPNIITDELLNSNDTSKINSIKYFDKLKCRMIIFFGLGMIIFSSYIFISRPDSPLLLYLFCLSIGSGYFIQGIRIWRSSKR